MRAGKPLDRDWSRREFISTAARVGAVAVASTVAAPSVVRAESNTIKIGHLTSKSGVRAAFSEPADWSVKQIRELLKDGLKVGSKTYPVEILSRDTQSTAVGAGEAGNALVLRDKVDLLLGDDADSHYAVGDLCDINGLPFVSTMTQWEPFIFTRKSTPEKGYPWSFLFFWGASDVMRNYVSLWDSLKTNKTAGTLYFDHPVGQAFADPKLGLPAGLNAGGYKIVDGGFFKGDADDFSNQINAFKAGGAQILTGFMAPPQFVTFWNQAAQLGYRPEVATIAAAFLFPSGIEALGDRGDGMTTEIWWTPNVPFKSSLTGETAKQVAAKWQSDTGKQWTQPLGYFHAEFEVALAALKNSGDPKDRAAVRNAIQTMNLDTLVGPVNFKDSKIKSVAVTEVAMGQWRRQKSESKFKYDLAITLNPTAPHIQIEEKTKLLSELG